ncbi:MAG: nuclear transport factor 2 family protein [Myxococcales bacterium]|nr:nuclear transport factor 2 family protein [Myxococcales bacterium]
MQPDTSSPQHILAAYFEGWNRHDAEAVIATFAPDGTFTDPTTASPIPAQEVGDLVRSLCSAMPDLHMQWTAALGSLGHFAVEWRLRGRNLGTLFPGVGPTEQTIDLAGIDVFTLDDSGIRSVRRYYDQKSLAEQLGLMALIQPIAQGPAQFGYSMRVASDNRKPPGVIALTWIAAASPSEKERIRAHSKQNVRDFLGEPGFLSIVTGFTGLRGFTVTAWEDEASMKRALSKHHTVAMRELFGESFVAAVWTSVWTPSRINRIWVRCPHCGSLEDVSDDHRSCQRCQSELPSRPAFW